jgi:very-short-patch-repair endonuclease
MDVQTIKIEEDFYSRAENYVALELQILGIECIRQYQIGKYFADFYFPEINVVLEVDGYIYHSSKEAFEHDRIRDKFMNDKGFTVIRVTGTLLKNNTSGVLNILKYFPKGKTFFLNSEQDIALVQKLSLNKN